MMSSPLLLNRTAVAGQSKCRICARHKGSFTASWIVSQQARRFPLLQAAAVVAPTAPSNGANGTSSVLDTPPLVRIPEPIPGVVPPPRAYETIVNLGVAKANLPPIKILALGVLAGVYIGFGAFLVMSVGGACHGIAVENPGLQKIIMGAFGLPFGLLMVLICGGELFTGNAALVTCAMYEGKAKLGQLAKSWAVSYGANLLGSLLLVFIVAQSGLLATAAAPLKMAVAKTSLTFTEAFARGVLCNWLVCIAIWQASAASTLGGKAIGVFFPISAFIALSLEHCVANMFIIPMGIVLGAPVTWAQFLTANLLPVTLGNVVGGALCVATSYAFIYGSLGKAKTT